VKLKTMPTLDRDERLAVALDELSARRRRGEPSDPAFADVPADLKDELRQLWAAHQLADALNPRQSTLNSGNRQTADPLPVPDSFGDFEMLHELGRGGMGVVYLARQKSLDRLVALKMILHGPMSSESDRARFRAEAGAAAKLVHPNIVTVHEVGELQGRPYFCMQYVDGETLARRLTRGPILPREAAQLVAAIARGIDHAHRQGIVHRDVKPSNVLLEYELEAISEKGHVEPITGEKIAGSSTTSIASYLHSFAAKISDFGLAKQADTKLTTSGAIIGTPSYMAPEQAAGRKDVGPSADVYSLGAVLYECLTGRPPFQAANPIDTIMMVLEQEPVAPRLLNAGVPRELEAIALKCLEKSPRRRYTSAAELAQDLEAYLTGELISATPSGFGYYLDRIFRETHHAEVLENWGLLWMWHSLVTLSLCTITQIIYSSGLGSHRVYLLLWGIGLVTWGAIFWSLRRRLGPVRFVERQVAHAWAAGVCASIGMFILEVLMDEPPLKFSPLLAVAAGMMFLVKAGVLTGIFYVAAIVMFATAVLMARFPDYGVLMFGVAIAGCFFFPGLKYYRQRRAGGQL
jgi:serine/threonine-protein kinase